MSRHDHVRSSDSPAPLDKKKYEKRLRDLQAQLVEMQQWVIESGARIIIVFEGRDAAGKGSAIKRITQYLNPRHTRVVALPAPTERERTQWYFQRYVPHLPAAGEIVIFDRSWYNRAGVERVMGFCTEAEYHRFMRQAPEFERMLVDDGILVLKYWFSVSDAEQEARFRSRAEDPMRRWKLSPMDVESITRWEDYSRAKDAMFAATDTPWARWRTVESEDKKRSRINVIADILNEVPWEPVELTPIEIPQRPPREKQGTEADEYQRPDRSGYVYVEDVAEELARERGKKGSSAKGTSQRTTGKNAKTAGAKSPKSGKRPGAKGNSTAKK